MRDVDFASLLCSRLCHDLVSPVGALSNGLEILAEETDAEMQAQCLALLSDSVRQTANRLKFFRLAFGGGGSFGEQVDIREAQAAIEGICSADKVSLHWIVGLPTLPKLVIKILLNLALIAHDALLRGGILQFGVEAVEGGIDVAIRASGPRILLGDDLRQALTVSDHMEQTPRIAPALLVRSLLDASHATLQISEPEPGAIVFGVRIPN